MSDSKFYVKIKDEQNIPRYATAGAAGADIMSTEECVIPINCSKLISTGVFLEIPEGYECQVRSRSGLAAKHGVFVLNSPGCVDSDYRGEVKVLLHNAGKKPFSVAVGDRIAQLIFASVERANFVVGDLSETKRNDGGFGSTGV